MIVLPVAAGVVVTLTAVWFVWSARRLWLFGEQKPQRAPVTVTVVRPIQSLSAVPGRPAAPGVARRIIRGEVER